MPSFRPLRRMVAAVPSEGDMAMSWKAMRQMIDRKAMRRMIDRDNLLRQLGLEQRSPGSDFLTGLGLFSVGVLVGAGLGLLFAPKRGEDVRAMMSDRWRNRNAAKLSAEGTHPMGAEAGVPPTTSTIGH
jgi:hypothetical protein